jgi:hypothetical protein
MISSDKLQIGFSGKSLSRTVKKEVAAVAEDVDAVRLATNEQQETKGLDTVHLAVGVVRVNEDSSIRQKRERELPMNLKRILMTITRSLWFGWQRLSFVAANETRGEESSQRGIP